VNFRFHVISNVDLYRYTLSKSLLKKPNLPTEDGVWQQLLRKKYVGSKAISRVLWKPHDSYFRVGIIATKKHFFPYDYFFIRGGSEIRF
jgi:hypothetical protein